MSTGGLRAWVLVHKWTSLVSTVFLLILALTGLPLIFHDEIDAWLDPPAEITQPAPGATKPGIGEIAAGYEQRHPGKRVLFLVFDERKPILTISGAPNADAKPEQFAIERISLLDGSVLEVVGREETGLMDVILRLHVDMFAGLPGTLFLGVMAILMLGSLVSGAVLYAPYLGRLRFGEIRHRRRAWWLDLHNMLGMVLLVWSVVVAATGVVNALAQPIFKTWRAQQTEQLAQLPGTSEGRAPLQIVIDQARSSHPDSHISLLAAPTTGLTDDRHYMALMRGSTPISSRLVKPIFIDASSGNVVRAEDPPSYLVALLMSQPLHFGDYGGLPLKILWALLDIATIVVLVSGLVLWNRHRTSYVPMTDPRSSEMGT